MFVAIEKYRTAAQVLLALIGVSFVGFGVAQFETRPNTQYIVKIGDQVITRYQLDNAVRNANNANRESVLRELMNRAYLLEGAKQLGLTVSETQIKQAIVDNQMFHDANGKFSQETLQNLLNQNGMTQQQFMDAVREDLLIDGLMNVFAENAVSDTQVAQILRATMATRVLRNVGVNPQAFESKVNADDASVKKFYDANQKAYTLPQAVQFEYVRFSPKTLAEKETLTDAEWKQALAEAKNSPNVKRTIAHILIPFGADKAKAKAEAEKIAKEAQANPKQFADLAKQYSQDDDSKAKGGVIGDFAASSSLVNAAFKETAFSVKSGEVSGVVESDFGFHIIKADDLAGGVNEDEIRAAAKEKKAQSAYNKLREQFSNEAFDNSGSLKAAADKLGLTIQTHSEWLTRDNAPVAKIPAAVVDALFSDDVFAKKHNSEAISADGETWFVRATQTRAEAAQPLDSIKDKVKQDFIRSESVRLAKAQAQTVLKELQAGKNPTLAWSDAQEVSPQQMQGNLSPESYRQLMATTPKDGKPAYVVLDNLGMPQIVEVQKINDLKGGDGETLKIAKQMIIPNAKSVAWREAFVDSLSKTIKTEQGTEKVSDSE